MYSLPNTEPGKGLKSMAWGIPAQTDAILAPIATETPSEPERGTMEWTAKHDTLLAAWQKAQETLARAKESEIQLRTEYGNFAFPVAGRKSGVNKMDIGGGYTAKLGHKVTHKIAASNEAVENAEDIAPKLGNEASFLFERIITWEPKFSVGEYNKLDANSPEHVKVKQLVDSLIEVGYGAPSLEIVAPKATLA